MNKKAKENAKIINQENDALFKKLSVYQKMGGSLLLLQFLKNHGCNPVKLFQKKDWGSENNKYLKIVGM